MTTAEAKAFLKERYAALAVRYPVGMAKVPLSLYLRRNLRAACRITAEDAANLREATNR